MNSDGWDKWSGGLAGPTWASDMIADGQPWQTEDLINQMPGGVDRSGSPQDPNGPLYNQQPSTAFSDSMDERLLAGGMTQEMLDAARAYQETNNPPRNYTPVGEPGGEPLGPMGGYVNPTQTYTPHTGYDRVGNGDGVFTNTPTGGGAKIPAPYLQDEEKILARPDLQGTGREAFQASQFASEPANPQAPAPNPTAEANARAQSLRNFDENRQRMGQQNLNAQSGNNAGTSMGPASPTQYQGVN
jgi:hypothetical protein